MNKGLVTAALTEIKERGGKFNSDPSIKQACYRVISIQMKVGTGNMMQAMQADPLFLLDELISTGYT